MLPDAVSTIRHDTYPALSPTIPAHSATGKTVIVSGGAGGIGYGIVQAFAKAGAAVVVILARRLEALDEAVAKLRAENAAAKRDTEVWSYVLDIKNSEATDQVFDAIRKRLNGSEPGNKDADILVANAAALTQGKTTLDFELAAYRETLDTNVLGNLNLIRAFLAPEAPSIPLTNLKGEVKATAPRPNPTHEKIILDVSTAGWAYDIPGQAPYAASKLAFTRILRTLHVELLGFEGAPIRIHSFNPGLVWTPGTSKLVEKNTKLAVWDDVSLPSHFAVWLASSAASFTSGRFLSANWDVDELVAKKKRFVEDAGFCTINIMC